MTSNSGVLESRSINSSVWGTNPLADITGTPQAGYATYWSDADTLASEQYLSLSRGGTGIGTTAPANGSLLIGNGTNYTVATLTAGTGIGITNASGSITIVNTGDLSDSNELQNLWATISSQSGTTTANSQTDTLTINGGGIASTSISGDTLTITATEAQQLFNTISVSGQSDVVADALTDTLTLAAGSNVTITTNATNDTITIAATDTNTTYTAGNGLTLASTTFKLGGQITEATRLYDGTYEFLYINPTNGYLGIGTTAPAYKLDVSGDVRIASGSKLIGATQNFIDTNRHGFLNQTETSISFDGTSVFTLTDAGSGWSYYRSGIKYTISGNKTIDLITVDNPLVDGTTYYIYIDSTTGALSAAGSSWTLNDTKVPVATVLWNSALTPKYQLAEERHTVLIDRRTHYWQHFLVGAKAVVAGAIDPASYTLNTDTNVAKTFSIAQTTFADEDLVQTLAQLPDPNGTAEDYVVFYRTGASTWAWKNSNMPFVYNVGNTNDRIQYDNNGTMTDSIANRWYNSYVLFTNFQGSARYVVIPGRNVFTSLANAQAEAPSSFSFTGFPVQEAQIAYRITWTTTSSTSQGKCRLAATPQSINLSAISAVSSGSSVDHNTLSGLQGGGSGEYYHLNSAQHTGLTGVTSGYLPYATSDGVLGDSNLFLTGGNVGIGTTSPAYKLDIAGTLGVGSTAYFASNVGIGTTAPSEKLEIVGNIRLSGATPNITTTTGLDLDLGDSAGSYTFDIRDSNDANLFTLDSLGSLTLNGQTASSAVFNLTPTGTTDLFTINRSGAGTGFAFRVNDGGAGDTSPFIITSAGNIGIGTTAPATGAKLHVEGQCVTGDTLLKRRRRKSRKGNGNTGEDEEWEDVRIDEIQPGDEILTLDESTGKYVVSKVNALMDMGIKSIFTLTTASGKTIRTTGNHPYFVRQKLPSGFTDVAGENVYRKEIADRVVKMLDDKNTEDKKEAGVSQAYAAKKVGIDKVYSTSQSIVPSDLEDVNTGEWVKVADINLGADIATVDGWERVVAIERTEAEQVYDIEVAGTHNFVANGIVAHNTYISGNLGIGTTAPGGKLDVKSTQTSGTLALVGAPSAVTLASSLTGVAVDLSTNYTATGYSVTGQTIALPAVTNTGASTYNYYGLSLTGGALTQNTGAGTDNFRGVNLTMPNITQTTGTINSDGLYITTGSITTGGTQNALNIVATGVGAGTLRGLNIGNITAGAGTETALQIGTGWDYGVYSATTGINYFGGKVGIGTTDPAASLEIVGAINQLQLSYDASNYNIWSVASDGTLSHNNNGTTIATYNSAGISFKTPTSFDTAGDVSMAYNLVMSNPVSSGITFEGAGTISTSHPSANYNLTLSAANSGVVLVDDALQVTNRITMDTWTADGDTAVYKNASGQLGLTSSDIRLKKNLEQISTPLEKIMGITGYLYNPIEEPDSAKKRLGVIAQDLINVGLPEATFSFTNGAGDEFFGVHYEKLTALLIEGLKEENLRVDDLAVRTSDLEKQATLFSQETQDLADKAQVEALRTEIDYIKSVLGLADLQSSQSSESTESSGLAGTGGGISGLGTNLLTSLQILYDNFVQLTEALGLKQVDGGLVVESSMTVLGDVKFADATITGNLSVGLLKIDSSQNSLGVVGPACYNPETGTVNDQLCKTQTLYVQKDLAGSVDFFNGAIALMPDGEIKTTSITAQVYGVDSIGQSVGEGIIPVGETNIAISSSAAKGEYKVFVTATSNTEGVELFVKDKQEGQFTVALSGTTALDVKFDWWVVVVE